MAYMDRPITQSGNWRSRARYKSHPIMHMHLVYQPEKKRIDAMFEESPNLLFFSLSFFLPFFFLFHLHFFFQLHSADCTLQVTCMRAANDGRGKGLRSFRC